jgi:hypothetical protein
MMSNRLHVYRPSGYGLAAAVVCFGFGFFGHVWILVQVLRTGIVEDHWIAVIALAVAELLGLYFFLEWKNRRIAINGDGIEVRSSIGRTSGFIRWADVEEARFAFDSESGYVLKLSHKNGRLAIPHTVKDFEDMARLIDRYVRAYGGTVAEFPSWATFGSNQSNVL